MVFSFKGQSDVTDGVFCVTRDGTDAQAMVSLPIAQSLVEKLRCMGQSSRSATNT
jgi:hypothetical protein